MNTTILRKLSIPLFAATLSAATLLGADASAGTVPLALTQQGRLLDTAGSPLPGAVSVPFALYDVDSGGVPLWKETQMLPLDDGYFSARLGTMNPIVPA